jgi:hypothetical protein
MAEEFVRTGDTVKDAGHKQLTVYKHVWNDDIRALERELGGENIYEELGAVVFGYAAVDPKTNEQLLRPGIITLPDSVEPTLADYYVQFVNTAGEYSSHQWEAAYVHLCVFLAHKKADSFSLVSVGVRNFVERTNQTKDELVRVKDAFNSECSKMGWEHIFSEVPSVQ